MPWTAGQVLTASLLNTYLPQGLTAYTPVMDGTGVTQGNATMTGGYAAFGKVIHFWAQAALGSTSVIGSGLQLSLPAGVNMNATNRHMGVYGRFTDTGTGTYMAFPIFSSVTRVQLFIPGTNGLATSPSSTSPFTWTTNDVVFVGGTYETA